MNDSIADEIFRVIKIAGHFEQNLHYSIEYKRCAVSLKALGYLQNPQVNKGIFEPTDLGREVLISGGWIRYNEQKAAKEIHENRGRKYWWIPHVIAVIAIIVSVILALYSQNENSNLQDKIDKIDRELRSKQLKIENRQRELEKQIEKDIKLKRTLTKSPS